MNSRRLIVLGACFGLMFTLGCKTIPPKDYTQFRAHMPKSVVVLPPLNESTDIEATYGYLAAVTRPLAERGYYVFPVAVVDRFLKENGMPTPGEMHQVPPGKVREILGADALLYITVKQYGSKYQVINSRTVVWARARLVDTATETLLWEGEGGAEANSGGSGNIIADLIGAAITQAVNSSTDAAHNIAPAAAVVLFWKKGQGLLYGPRHPDFGKDGLTEK